MNTDCNCGAETKGRWADIHEVGCAIAKATGQASVVGDTDFRIVPCGGCDGSGVEVFGVTVYEHGCGFSHDSTDERPCRACNGTGSEIVPVEPITLEDLEAV